MVGAVRRAAIFSTLDRYASLGINFVSVALVSRLLEPDEIGIMALVAALILAVEMIRDVVTGYLIQTPEASDEDVRSAFTMMAAITLLLMALLVALAPVAAVFAHEARLGWILPLAAVSLIFGPFERPLMALLRRDMEFGTVTVVNLIGMAMSVVVTVASALAGAGAASGVLGNIGGLVAFLAALLIVRPRFDIFRPSVARWPEIGRFVVYNNSTALLSQGPEILPPVLLSHFGTAAAVGAFNRATVVAQLPTKAIVSAIAPVVLPALAQQARLGADLSRPMALMFELLSGAKWPALVLLALLAHPIVAVLLGPAWTHVVPYVQVLAIAAAPAFVWQVGYSLLVAAGGVRLTTIAAIVYLAVSAPVIAAGAYFGLMPLVAGYLVLNLAQAAITLYLLRGVVGFVASDIVWRCVRSLPAVAGAAAGALVVALPLAGGLDMSVPTGIVAGLAGLAGWGIGLKTANHALWHEIAHIAERLAATPAGAALGSRAAPLVRRLAVLRGPGAARDRAGAGGKARAPACPIGIARWLASYPSF